MRSESAWRIALVTETFPPEVNGVAHTCQHFVQGIQNQGHQVQLIRPQQAQTDPPSPSASLQHVTVNGLPLPGYRGLRFGLPAGRYLRKLWRSQRPDIVHIITEGPLGASALHVARSLRLPVIAGFHTNFHQYSQHYRLGLLRAVVEHYLRHFHNRCDLTLTPTQDMATHLSKLGIGHTAVLGRGVDTRLFNPQHRSMTLRQQWGVRNDPVVLYVGRLAPEKNLALAVNTFLAMRQVAANARFVLVGDGPQAQDLKKRYPEFVFTGVQRGLVLAQCYASADVFLFPSLTETFGNVTLEAMASGLAVVAFKYAAAGQHIEHQQHGLLAPFADAVTFISCARSLLVQNAGAQDFSLRQQLGMQARRRAVQLGWDHICTELLAYYAQLMHYQQENPTHANRKNIKPQCA